MTFRPTRTACIQEELMMLTRNNFQAIVLNQFLYWTRRCYEFDEMLAQENKIRESMAQEPVNMRPYKGWFQASLSSLAEETMMLSSKDSLRSFVSSLIDRGWVEKRATSDFTQAKETFQYRVNLSNLSKDLTALGYKIPGFIFAQEGGSSRQQKESVSSQKEGGLQENIYDLKSSPDSDLSYALYHENESTYDNRLSENTDLGYTPGQSHRENKGLRPFQNHGQGYKTDREPEDDIYRVRPYLAASLDHPPLVAPLDHPSLQKTQDFIDKASSQESVVTPFVRSSRSSFSKDSA